MKVGIIGGGINGFCCGVNIKEQIPNADVTILSELFTPNTTGDGSAGLWGPYLMEDTPESKIHEWSLGMHQFLKKLWLSGDGGEAGISLIPCIRLATCGSTVNDFWKDIVYGYKWMTESQLKEYSDLCGKKFTSGIHFITFTSEPVKLLPYLTKRFTSLGGKLRKEKIVDFDNFVRNSEYDVIINCTGLGAKTLLKDDSVMPIRGQVTRVKANWIRQVILDESDDGNYIIPNVDTVVLGGTHQRNDYNLEVSTADKAFILNGCKSYEPSLKYAEHLFDWVGLRPGRQQVRLEMKNFNNKIVIHNYGHGGSGVTLAWGCSVEVLELLKTASKSKL